MADANSVIQPEVSMKMKRGEWAALDPPTMACHNVKVRSNRKWLRKTLNEFSSDAEVPAEETLEEKMREKGHVQKVCISYEHLRRLKNLAQLSKSDRITFYTVTDGLMYAGFRREEDDSINAAGEAIIAPMVPSDY